MAAARTADGSVITVAGVEHATVGADGRMVELRNEFTRRPADSTTGIRPDREKPEVVSRLERAMSSGDANQVAACFAGDFQVVTPLHPSRGFTGNEKVRQNWAAIFAQVPDRRGRLLR